MIIKCELVLLGLKWGVLVTRTCIFCSANEILLDFHQTLSLNECLFLSLAVSLSCAFPPFPPPSPSVWRRALAPEPRAAPQGLESGHTLIVYGLLGTLA